jgi:hypothetical protein
VLDALQAKLGEHAADLDGGHAAEDGFLGHSLFRFY